MSDVEGLAEVLRAADDEALGRTNFGQIVATYDETARAILASPWLAARVQAARAEALEEAAATAIGCEHTDSMAWCHICDDWVTALRARAAAIRADDAGGEGL